MDSDAKPEGPAEARYDALAARLFRPARPRLLECVLALTGAPEAVCRRAIATGRGDPLLFFTQSWDTSFGRRSYTQPSGAEGWEAFAPLDWVGDAARAFECAGEPPREVPPNVRTALALCADPAGVVAAEALAREAAVRLAACGVAVDTARVIWRAIDPRLFRVWVRASTSPAADAQGAGLFRKLCPSRPSPRQLAEAARASAPVRAAAARVGACADDAGDLVEWDLVLREKKLERNPFEPLVAVWEAGYGFDRATPEGMVLVAPEVTRATTREA